MVAMHCQPLVLRVNGVTITTYFVCKRDSVIYVLCVVLCLLLFII